MVAVIHAGKSLREALNYNENKVVNGVAELLEAGYYLKDPKDLGFHEKLSRMQRLMDLNENVKVNTLHISLNFAPEESLSIEKLKEVAAVYLEKIGFARQPYLLYEHRDVAHQHVHIVTTSIKPDGSSIKLHNIGRNQSETARKEIENEFGLVKAEQHRKNVYELKAVDIQRVIYGRSQTKQAISNVLNTVLQEYKFSSVPELNAILRQYNIMADRGSEDSRIYKSSGLVYRILDAKANRVGVPIKASDFHFKPTLKYLQQQFEINKQLRSKHMPRVKNSIDFFLSKQHTASLEGLAAAMAKDGISVIQRRSENGQLYGITYIDYHTKCVFNGSALGKQYSAKAMVERCSPTDINSENARVKTSLPLANGTEKSFPGSDDKPAKATASLQSGNQKGPGDTMIEKLFASVSDNAPVPWQFRKKKRKKRRKNIL